MKTEEIKDRVSNFVDLLNKTEGEWSSISDELSHLEGEFQDLIHEIEFGIIDYTSGYNLALEIRALRERRRELKRRQEVLAHIKAFVDSGAGKQSRTDLCVVLSRVKKTMESQEAAEYTPRVRRDLTIVSKVPLASG